MKPVNVVLGGGGVKGVALVGAIAAIEDAGYSFNVVAGNSAGAIVAALVSTGMPVAEIRDILGGLNFESVLDSPVATGRIALAMQGLSVIRGTAIHTGDNLMKWMDMLLADQGVHTFGDVRRGGDDVPMEERYRLVVPVADITHGRILRLPWDYHVLGLDPDKQSIAEAVRAATALPLLYQPHMLGGATLIDAGIVGNFPIGVMRKLRDQIGPTIGLRLSFVPELAELNSRVRTLPALARAAIITAMNAQDDEMMTDPVFRENSVFIDVDGVKITDFQITKPKQKKLYDNGYAITTQFLQQWPG